MANSFTSFSVEFQLPTEAAHDLEKLLEYASELEQDEEDREATDVPDWVKQYAESCFDDWYGCCSYEHFEITDKEDGTSTVWVADWETSAVYLAMALFGVMHHYDLPGKIYLQEAYTCSKLRVDEFGGGAYYVDKNEWLAMGTVELSRILPEVIEQMRENNGKKNNG